MALFSEKRNCPAFGKKPGLSLLVGFLFIFCLGIIPGSAWSKDIEVLRIGIPTNIPRLLPIGAGSVEAFNISSLIYSPLVEISAEGEPVPHLATDWEYSADGKTTTVKLRRGVTYTDGSAFTAYNVKNWVDILYHPQIHNPAMTARGASQAAARRRS